jgi:hypothetical protein
MYMMRLESCLDWHQALCLYTFGNQGGWRLPLPHGMQMQLSAAAGVHDDSHCGLTGNMMMTACAFVAGQTLSVSAGYLVAQPASAASQQTGSPS